MKTLIYLLLLSMGGLSIFTNYKNSDDVPYRQKMREFVIGISKHAKDKANKEGKQFYIIPQNGIQLILTGEKNDTDRKLDVDYLQAIDGVGQEDLFYGGGWFNYSKTPKKATNYLTNFLDIAKKDGKKILVTDYCRKKRKIDNSYLRNTEKGYTSFGANERDLSTIPPYPSSIPKEKDNEIENLSQVKNFLYLINFDKFNSKDEFITSAQKTNYDLIIMDAFFQSRDNPFTKSEIERLRKKENKGNRLVIAYMSIGEAENYRYYWKEKWKDEKPEWLDEENPKWKKNYKVKYWHPEWQKLIYGTDTAYLDTILNVGFDGVYMDIIDGFQYYEDK